MAAFYAKATAALVKRATPISLVAAGQYSDWLKAQTAATRQWLGTVWSASPKAGQHIVLPDEGGAVAQVVAIISDQPDAVGGTWDIAALPFALPVGTYRLDGVEDREQLFRLCLGWGLGAYQFNRYKSDAKTRRAPATLLLPTVIDGELVTVMAESIGLGRDLINVPAEDMGPPELAAAVATLAKAHGGKVRLTSGKALQEGFPLVHAIGRAGPKEPVLIDMTWGNPKHPKVTLVGKGVCFDTGGLDIKPAGGMYHMKKDMGGAAVALSTARMIMATGLPVRLRVIIPAVENSVSANSIRPRDIVKSRAGITVEIENTDAEGRLILADALALAVEDKPDLIVDMATLTGSKMATFGPDIGVFFGTDDALCAEISAAATKLDDPLWRLPIWTPYAFRIDSPIADTMQSSPAAAVGDPIIAALFLKKFAMPAKATWNWLHFDIYCMYTFNRPGRPDGGEAQAARALFTTLQGRYKPVSKRSRS